MTVLNFNLNTCSPAKLREEFKATWEAAKISKDEPVIFRIDTEEKPKPENLPMLEILLGEILPTYTQVHKLVVSSFTCDELLVTTRLLGNNKLKQLKTFVIDQLVVPPMPAEMQEVSKAKPTAYLECLESKIDTICEQTSKTHLKKVVLEPYCSETIVADPSNFHCYENLSNKLFFALEDTGIKFKSTLATISVLKPEEDPPELQLDNPIPMTDETKPTPSSTSKKRKAEPQPLTEEKPPKKAFTILEGLIRSGTPKKNAEVEKEQATVAMPKLAL